MAGSYERVISDDGRVEVPNENVGREACVIDARTGVVISYEMVERDGIITVDETFANIEAMVVITPEEDNARVQ